MYVVVEPRAQQSTAKHSAVARPPLHKAASNQVRADQSTYQKKYIGKCMLRPVCFPGAWSTAKVVRVPVPVLWAVNDSPVRVIFEDSVLRVPGGLK